MLSLRGPTLKKSYIIAFNPFSTPGKLYELENEVRPTTPHKCIFLMLGSHLINVLLSVKEEGWKQ